MATRKELILGALGEASVCWEGNAVPPGVFDATKAERIATKLYAELFLGEKRCGNCLHWKELYEGDCIEPAEGHCRYLPIKHGGFPVANSDQCCRCHEFIVEIDGEVRDAK